MSRLAPFFAVAFLAAACNPQKPVVAEAKKPAADAGKAAASTPADPKAPAGKYEGGTVITNAELDEFAKDEMKKLEDAFDQNRYQLRKDALDALVVKRIIEARAAKEGIKAEDLMKREVTDKAQAPTDKEMKAVYDQAKAQGQPLPPYAEVKPQIEQYLVNTKARDLLAAYYEKVRNDANIEVLLVKPAVAELASDATSAVPAAAPQETK